MMDTYYRLSSAAEKLDLSVHTLRGWIREGRLAAVNIGTPGAGADWRVAERELRRIVGEREVQTSGPDEGVVARTIGEMRRKAAA